MLLVTDTPIGDETYFDQEELLQAIINRDLEAGMTVKPELIEELDA